MHRFVFSPLPPPLRLAGSVFSLRYALLRRSSKGLHKEIGLRFFELNRNIRFASDRLINDSLTL